MGFLDGLFNRPDASTIRRITPQEAKSNLENDKNIILLDVRDSYEYNTGHTRGAKNLSVSIVDEVINTITTD